MSEPFYDIELKLKEKKEFFSSFSSLYESGIPLDSIFNSISASSSDKKIKAVCSVISNGISHGLSLKEALMPCSKALGLQYTPLIAAGEEAGKLEDVLAGICSNINKQEEIKSNLIEVLLYPAGLILISIGTLMLFQFFVIPSFKAAGGFSDTADTGILLTSAVFKIITVYASIGAGIFCTVKIKSIKDRIINIIFSLPLINNILKNYYCTNVLYIMKLAYEAGIPLSSCVRTASSAAGLSSMQLKLNRASKMIEKGSSISKALSLTGIFSSYALSEISAGEISGRLEKTLKNAASDYEKQTDKAVKMMTKLLGASILFAAGTAAAFILYKGYTEYYNAIFRMI